MSSSLVRTVRRAVAVVATGVIVAATPAPTFADPTAAVPVEKVTVDVVTANGTGCRAGTFAVTQAPDNTFFYVTYNDYVARKGPGATPVDFRKTCQLSLRIKPPKDYRYAIAQVIYNGYALLPPGGSGFLRASYYAVGSPQRPPVQARFAGPYDDFWRVIDTADPTTLIWTRCGEDHYVTISTDLRLQAGTSHPSATSLLAMTSVDGTVTTAYVYAWQLCPRTSAAGRSDR